MERQSAGLAIIMREVKEADTSSENWTAIVRALA